MDVREVNFGREYGSFVDMVEDLPKFLTMWSVLFVVAHKYIHSVVNLQLLSLLVMFGGFMISYANDNNYRYLKVGGICAPPWLIYVIDMAFHVLPFLFVQYHYSDYYHNVSFGRAAAQAGAVLGIVAVYMALVDPMEQYSISRETYSLILRGAMEIFLIYLLVTRMYDASKKN